MTSDARLVLTGKSIKAVGFLADKAKFAPVTKPRGFPAAPG
jgi:hypothetical protein